MFKFGLCLILFACPAFADLRAQRDFYARIEPHVRPTLPALTEAQTVRIQNLNEKDIDGYVSILLESWLELLPDHRRRELELVASRINFVPAENFPAYSLDAQVDQWNIVNVLLPAKLEKSVLYYYLVFHELDHARQRLAIHEHTDLTLGELRQMFWAEFEIERSAMTMEWFYLHHLPPWGRRRLALDIGGLLMQDAASALAVRSAMAAKLPLEDYLKVHWAAGRYSWEELHDKSCRAELGRAKP